MVVRIIKATADKWYSECIGECFEVFTLANSPFLIFSDKLFFYPEDVALEKCYGAYVAIFHHGLA